MNTENFYRQNIIEAINNHEIINNHQGQYITKEETDEDFIVSDTPEIPSAFLKPRLQSVIKEMKKNILSIPNSSSINDFVDSICDTNTLHDEFNDACEKIAKFMDRLIENNCYTETIIEMLHNSIWTIKATRKCLTLWEYLESSQNLNKEYRSMVEILCLDCHTIGIYQEHVSSKTFLKANKAGIKSLQGAKEGGKKEKQKFEKKHKEYRTAAKSIAISHPHYSISQAAKFLARKFKCNSETIKRHCKEELAPLNKKN